MSKDSFSANTQNCDLINGDFSFQSPLESEPQQNMSESNPGSQTGSPGLTVPTDLTVTSIVGAADKSAQQLRIPPSPEPESISAMEDGAVPISKETGTTEPDDQRTGSKGSKSTGGKSSPPDPLPTFGIYPPLGAGVLPANTTDQDRANAGLIRTGKLGDGKTAEDKLYNRFKTGHSEKLNKIRQEAFEAGRAEGYFSATPPNLNGNERALSEAELNDIRQEAFDAGMAAQKEPFPDYGSPVNAEFKARMAALNFATLGNQERLDLMRAMDILKIDSHARAEVQAALASQPVFTSTGPATFGPPPRINIDLPEVRDIRKIFTDCQKDAASMVLEIRTLCETMEQRAEALFGHLENDENLSDPVRESLLSRVLCLEKELQVANDDYQLKADEAIKHQSDLVEVVTELREMKAQSRKGSKTSKTKEDETPNLRKTISKGMPELSNTATTAGFMSPTVENFCDSEGKFSEGFYWSLAKRVELGLDGPWPCSDMTGKDKGLTSAEAKSRTQFRVYYSDLLPAITVEEAKSETKARRWLLEADEWTYQIWVSCNLPEKVVRQLLIEKTKNFKCAHKIAHFDLKKRRLMSLLARIIPWMDWSNDQEHILNLEAKLHAIERRTGQKITEFLEAFGTLMSLLEEVGRPFPEKAGGSRLIAAAKLPFWANTHVNNRLPRLQDKTYTAVYEFLSTAMPDYATPKPSKAGAAHSAAQGRQPKGEKGKDLKRARALLAEEAKHEAEDLVRAEALVAAATAAKLKASAGNALYGGPNPNSPTGAGAPNTPIRKIPNPAQLAQAIRDVKLGKTSEFMLGKQEFAKAMKVKNFFEKTKGLLQIDEKQLEKLILVMNPDFLERKGHVLPQRYKMFKIKNPDLEKYCTEDKISHLAKLCCGKSYPELKREFALANQGKGQAN